MYNKDAVVLCSVKMVCNRPPSLYCSYKGNEYKFKDSRDKKLKKQFDREIKGQKIIASIEYASRWRVEAYHTATVNEKDSENFLYVGDVIALYLSEMKLYVNAVKPYDPFNKILQLLNIETQSIVESQNSKDQLLKITRLGKPDTKQLRNAQ